MPSLDSLKEEIHDVFLIFDEDESGSISLPELTRALYTITGERTSRSELLKLVAAARESIAKEVEEQRQEQLCRLQQEQNKEENSSPGGSECKEAGKTGVINGSPLIGPSQQQQQQRKQDNSDGVDAEVFERVVLRVMNSRSMEEELVFTFGLLEDKYYPGFITKESLKRAAAETEEPLTEAEILEMFDSMVTGIPSAAIDFTTFSNIQTAARRLEDA